VNLFAWLFGWGRRQRRKAARDQQSAALPWRQSSTGALEILLITSRETRRWVIPKGWPMPNLGSGPSAAQEAHEEAGVRGELSPAPLGSYTYDKRLKRGRTRAVRVEVYGLEVRSEDADWRERGQREKAWLTPDEAARRVDEPELQALIASFRP
jgi:8-oxo-dGTP pyrophosphatase MutT (NUDIX family)